MKKNKLLLLIVLFSFIQGCTSEQFVKMPIEVSEEQGNQDGKDSGKTTAVVVKTSKTESHHHGDTFTNKYGVT